MRVMIVVTHLLGTGHLARAMILARAFHACQDQVVVVSGGFPVPRIQSNEVDFLQLAPLRSDGVNFSRLLTQGGTSATAELFEQRQRTLLATFDAFRPHALITELYPFGRRVLRSEFNALLEHAKAGPVKPMIFSSIRDILAPPSKPEKANNAEQLILEYYDGVLVHSDATIVPLAKSWPVTDKLQEKLVYTGFVAPPGPAPNSQEAGKGEILVSAGGGAVGAALFTCIVEVAAQLKEHNFRILVGGDAALSSARNIQETAPANVIVEPARPDFRQMLQHAKASISMCGYNTALDILQTGCPAVFVPFDAGSEVEQGIRATSLKHLSGIQVVESVALSASTIAAALRSVIAAPRREAVTGNMDGAAQTSHIVRQMVERSNAI